MSRLLTSPTSEDEGHSLMALRIISGIRQEFNVEIEIAELVDEPTIAGISKIILERKVR